ncbi:Uncharacterised protein [Photobacterium damselae]|nr:Uncharacterised protein [Photobacterium damselae]
MYTKANVDFSSFQQMTIVRLLRISAQYELIPIWKINWSGLSIFSNTSL